MVQNAVRLRQLASSLPWVLALVAASLTLHGQIGLDTVLAKQHEAA